MSSPAVHISLDVLAWWYRKAQEAVARYEWTVEHYPPLSEPTKTQRREGYEMALKTVEALKGVFEKDIICEMEDTSHE